VHGEVFNLALQAASSRNPLEQQEIAASLALGQLASFGVVVPPFRTFRSRTRGRVQQLPRERSAHWC